MRKWKTTVPFSPVWTNICYSRFGCERFLSLIPIEEGTDLLESARTIEPFVTQLATFNTSSADDSWPGIKRGLPVSFLSSV